MVFVVFRIYTWPPTHSIYVNAPPLPSSTETAPWFFAEDTALLTDSNNPTELQTLPNTELVHINP